MPSRRVGVHIRETVHDEVDGRADLARGPGAIPISRHAPYPSPGGVAAENALPRGFPLLVAMTPLYKCR